MNRLQAAGLGLNRFVTRRSWFGVAALLAILSGATGVALSNVLDGQPTRRAIVAPKGQVDLILRSGFEPGETSVICAPDASDLDGDGLLDARCIIDFVPPDPSVVAPPLDPTVPANVADATEFIYRLPNPIQRGVAPGAIERYRAGVVRGLVKDSSGLPLPGVLVRVLDHPELGYTYTRADGMFDLAVNAGGAMTVDYRKPGFLRAQRTLDTRWQDWVWARETVLAALDQQVTTVTTGPAAPQQIARGSVQTDIEGSRQATLIFPAGVSAALVFADGRRESTSSLRIRATEYTVGPSGRQRMPAALPSSSGYTYAVELSADEAIAAGAQSVEFSAPVAVYFENYLDAAVGMTIPVGSYDFRLAQWLPEDNGRVVRVLAVSGGLAELDLNGSGTAATEADYMALGIGFAERQRVAQLYAVGAQLWRFSVRHFTPWDCNVPHVPGPDDEPPPDEPPTPDEPSDGPCPGGGACADGDDDPDGSEPDESDSQDTEEETDCGSVINCESGSLRKAISVPGTGMALVYDSSKVPGRQDRLAGVRVRVTSASIPPSLVAVRLEIETLGHRIAREYPRSGLSPNMVVTVDVPRNDAYGRDWPSPSVGSATLTYAYPLRLAATNSEFARTWAQFGSISGLVFSRDPSIGTYDITRITGSALAVVTAGSGPRRAGSWDARGQGFGGWTLSGHHVFDPAALKIYAGTGGAFRTSLDSRAEVSTLRSQAVPLPGGTGALRGATLVAAAPDGGLFIIGDAPDATPGAGSSDGLYRMAPGGNTELWVNACDLQVGARCGSGEPVIRSISVDLQGRAVFSDGDRVFLASARNVAEVVANRELLPRDCASISQIAGREGRIFFVCAQSAGSEASDWIGSVWRDRQVTVLAGGGSRTDDGTPAEELSIFSVNGLAVDAGGNILVSEPHVIWRITPRGIAEKILGNGTSDSTPDGGLARGSGAGTIGALQLDAAGRVLLFDQNTATLREIRPDGRLSTLAGGGTLSLSDVPAAGGIARSVQVQATGMTALPDGSVLMIASQGQSSPATLSTIVNSAYTSFGRLDADPQQYLIPSRTGSEYYVFNRQGRHLETRRSDTGGLIRRFEYNPRGYVTAIVDAFNNRTTIERGASDRPSAMVSPDGIRTVFSYDSNGNLASVDAAETRSWSMTYRSDGLMTRIRDPRNQDTQFEWSNARLVGHRDALNNARSLAPTRWMSLRYERRTLTSREGKVSSFDTDRDFDGSGWKDIRRSNGLRYIQRETVDGITETRFAGRRVMVSAQRSPDPRFGLAASFTSSGSVVMEPSDVSPLAYSVSRAREVTPIVANAQLGQLDLTETTIVNGRMYLSTYDAANRVWSRSSPAGRVTVTAINASGQPVRVAIPELAELENGYDARGRLTSVAAGVGADRREWRFAYDSRGYLVTITDPLDRVTTLINDPIGRVTEERLPGSRVVGLRYDGNSNIVGITPPGRAEHTFAYNALDRVQRYTPPALPGLVRKDTSYSYNRDQQVTGIDRPDARPVALSYANTTDFLNRIATLSRAVDFSRDDAGRVISTTVDGVASNQIAYLGDLLARDGDVRFDYDANFWLRSVRYPSSPPSAVSETTYDYDADGLLSEVSVAGTSMALTRNAANGLLEATRAQRVSDTWQYNPFAEPTNYEVRIDAAPVYSTTFLRDHLGRITRKTELIAGVTTVSHYAYDAAGRIDAVTVGGVVRADYDYDSNSNRTSVTYRAAAGAPTTFAGSYDAQDRMIAYGPWAYQYTANGELARRTHTATNARTDYVYDEFGNLRTVTLPDGRAITYSDDGFNRRVGKSIDGTVVQRFVYMNELEPVVELDASGNVVSTFAYADRANTPSLMRRAGSAYRILADHLGSVRLVVNVATGQIAQRMDYDEFGNVTLDTSPGFQPFGFLGGIYDRDTGLVRLGARGYDPATGRWTAKDPAGFSGGENFYLYGDGDPVNMADVSGETPVPVVLGFLAAYARCTASCTALSGLSAALLSECDVDLPSLTGDCASSCLNPLNWLRISAAQKSVGHHTIPKAIQKRLPPPVRNHPDVVGRQGNPNIRNIPKPAHDRVHTSAPGPYHPGGNYNRRFDQLIQERGGYGAVSPRDIVEIRDQLVREFKL